MSKLISLSVLAVVLLLGSFIEATQGADEHSQLQQNDYVCKTFFEWVIQKDCSSDCSQKKEALYKIDFLKYLLLHPKIFDSKLKEEIRTQQDELKIQKRNRRRKENASSTNAHQSAHHDSDRQEEEKEEDISTNQETDNYKNLSFVQVSNCIQRAMELNEELVEKLARLEYPTKYYEWD